ncbi:copper chaperone PCu(A)C [Nioella ostreopsis]|jgi:copper(I)-binding protein|uniref:copper chaperone PCu(A)C n=1 Tax=Nioella ostreopsis TaxID=2448479 RepID=UPI000FDB2664|nr:copper chaperone PCu(A)C [Nioella ostreopsis]
MSFKSTLLAGVAALSFALPAFADGIMIHDPYARASAMMSQSGAAFMEIMNQTDTDDRLIAARSDVAQRVELHTHLEDDNGVMRMVEVEEGFAIPAGGSHALARGGDHVMFLGLNQPFEHGDEIEVTLVFEQAGEMTVTIPIDLERNPMRQQMQGHGQMNHGNMGNAASD